MDRDKLARRIAKRSFGIYNENSDWQENEAFVDLSPSSGAFLWHCQIDAEMIAALTGKVVRFMHNGTEYAYSSPGIEKIRGQVKQYIVDDRKAIDVLRENMKRRVEEKKQDIALFQSILQSLREEKR